MPYLTMGIVIATYNYLIEEHVNGDASPGTGNHCLLRETEKYYRKTDTSTYKGDRFFAFSFWRSVGLTAGLISRAGATPGRAFGPNGVSILSLYEGKLIAINRALAFAFIQIALVSDCLLVSCSAWIFLCCPAR